MSFYWVLTLYTMLLVLLSREAARWYGGIHATMAVPSTTGALWLLFEQHPYALLKLVVVFLLCIEKIM